MTRPDPTLLDALRRATGLAPLVDEVECEAFAEMPQLPGTIRAAAFAYVPGGYEVGPVVLARDFGEDED